MKKTFKELGNIAVIMVMVIIMAVIINANVTHAKTVFKDGVNGYTLTVNHYRGKTIIRWNGKKYRTYRGYLKVEMIDGAELYKNNKKYNKLVHRKNKKIIIEKCHGYCNRNDYYKSGTIDGGDYIAYRCLGNKVKPGDEIYTWFVFNPRSNYDDDRDCRFDVPTKYHWR